MGQTAAAIESHGAGLEVQRDLVREWPPITLYRLELAKGLNHLGGHLRTHGSPEEALTVYREARSLLNDLVRDHPAGANFKHEFARSLLGLAGLRRTMGDPAEALGSAKEALTKLPEIARCGCRRSPTAGPRHSLCSELIGRDPARPTPEERAERRAHAEAALAALRRVDARRRAVGHGGLLEDPDLVPLRPNPEFQAMRLDAQIPGRSLFILTAASH